MKTSKLFSNLAKEMNIIRMDSSILKPKFRGSMLGALVGDCLGSPFEYEEVTPGSKLVLQDCFDKLEGPMFKAPVKQFSDDSDMTYSLACSLVENKGLDLTDLAKRFIKRFYTEPNRGYGPGVVRVFAKLRGNKCKDVLTPAKEQFNGLGSFGNGAAMRVSPIALYCYNHSDDLLIDMARKQSSITHAHKLGIDGAILQAMAVHQALHLDPAKELNAVQFIDELIHKMTSIESDEEGLDLMEPQPYKNRLELMKKYISEEGEGPHDQKVVHDFGRDVSAFRSVPTAIFCFLRARKPIKSIQTDNPLRRAIQYAISLGGDADTIGSMTGAISGAFYGEEKFSSNLLQHCEMTSDFQKVADDLHTIAMGN